MQSSLVILCLFFFVSVNSSVHDDGLESDPSADVTACSEMLPVVDNGEVSSMSLKSNYTEGDKLLYTCQPGYVSLGKIIYICNKKQWVSIRNGKCSRKRCELPADIPNGRYEIINGTDFVYGATIKYICKEGYQMVSRIDTRMCLAGGWNNHLPVCAELSCVPPETESNIIMDGLPDYGDTLRYGHRVQFTCNSPGLKLVGSKEVTCQEDGEWSSPLPRCEEATCEFKEISDTVSVAGLPGKYVPIKYGHTLRFYCSRSDMTLIGRGEVTCSTGGTWSSPFPTCEAITCKEETLINVKIVWGDPSTAPPYKPKHTLHFQCSYHYMTMNGPSSVTCRSDGTWSSQYPTCLEYGACGQPPNDRYAKLTTAPKAYYRNGESVQYTCPANHRMEGNPYVTCYEGRWTSTRFSCLENCIVKKNEMDDRKIQPYYYEKQSMTVPHGYALYFACEYGRKPNRDSYSFNAQCNRGLIHLPICH
ncbi:hypothetical protein NFI96_023422 [Prochilodus magdalenae]|nr:hypothetical protein NFI96_023422 [Prochilodus magdalenae]